MLIALNVLLHVGEVESAGELLKPVVRVALFGSCIWALLRTPRRGQTHILRLGDTWGHLWSRIATAKALRKAG